MRSDDSLKGVRLRWHIAVGGGTDRSRRLKARRMQQDRLVRRGSDDPSGHRGVRGQRHGDERDPHTGEARLEVRRNVHTGPARGLGIRSARGVSVHAGSAADEGLGDGSADHSKSDDCDGDAC